MEAVKQSWFYGPKGEADVFEHGKEPKGWADHPAKVKKAPAKPEAE